jgi:hypothetical protein
MQPPTSTAPDRTPEAGERDGAVPPPFSDPRAARVDAVGAPVDAGRGRGAVLVVYACVVALARALQRATTVDVEFDDESWYLNAGLDFMRSGPPTAEGSPLYALWYWIESRFVPDPISLYYANWGVLVCATLIALAAALRAVGAGRLGTFVVVSVFSGLSYFEVWPHVTLLSGALVLAAVAVAASQASAARGLSAAAALLAFAVFVRPELLVAFALCVVAAVVAAVRERQLAVLVVPAVTIAVLCAAFGAPLGGSRSMLAFGQHYARNVATARGLDVDFWNEWERFVRADFGAASTPAAALRANWRAFAWHVGRNLVAVPTSAYVAISAPVRALLGTPLVAALAVGVARAVGRARRDPRALRLLVVGGAIAVSWAVSATIVAPRVHYAMASFVALVPLATSGLLGLRWPWAPPRPLVVVPATLLLVGCAGWVPTRGPLPHVATVRLLRTVPPSPARVAILEPDFGRGVYAGIRHTRLRQADCTPFGACLETRRPDVVVCDARLRAHYAGDEGFRAFERSPGESGYREERVAGTDVRVYVRRALVTR